MVLINATSMFILKTDKRMETAKRALAAVCSAEANEAVAKYAKECAAFKRNGANCEQFDEYAERCKNKN